MKKLLLPIALFTCVSAAVHAESACERLSVPELDYTADTPLAEVVKMQSAVKEFVASSEAYLKCIDAEKARGGDDATEEQRSEWLTLYNNTVDEMKSTADRFNAIVKEYKAAHPK